MKSNAIKINKTIHRHNLHGMRFIVSFMLSAVFSLNAMANSTEITSSMSTEVAAEFNKQLSVLTYPLLSTKLLLMSNPYGGFISILNEDVGDKESPEYNPIYHRRLLTHDENLLKAKSKRFSICQNHIIIFMAFTIDANHFSTANYPLSKEQVFSAKGIDYPFTQEQAEDDIMRPQQIALELGWKYQGDRETGMAEKHVDTFFKACLEIPISLYYWEDKF
ncbi:MAG: hypothetical protein V5788_02485 [Shewanella sp.]